jgi:hypothetical protein
LTRSGVAGGATDAEAFADVDSASLGQVYFDATACAGSCVSGQSPSFNVSQALSLATNTVYAIYLAAGGQDIVTGTFSATVDPAVVFAPGFDSTGYAITFSPDPAPVPVPAAVWLFLGGVGGLAVLGRMRPAQ